LRTTGQRADQGDIGAKEGGQGLYVTLSETANELRTAAASHGWELGDGIEIFEVAF
jgi:circadian clock protein KaiC